jgi:hypothetical protein
VVEIILGTLAGRLPAGTRRHLLAHLPADVGALAARERWRAAGRPARAADDLIDAVAGIEGTPRADAEMTIRLVGSAASRPAG